MSYELGSAEDYVYLGLGAPPKKKIVAKKAPPPKKVVAKKAPPPKKVVAKKAPPKVLSAVKTPSVRDPRYHPWERKKKAPPKKAPVFSDVKSGSSSVPKKKSAISKLAKKVAPKKLGKAVAKVASSKVAKKILGKAASLTPAGGISAMAVQAAKSKIKFKKRKNPKTGKIEVVPVNEAGAVVGVAIPPAVLKAENIHVEPVTVDRPVLTMEAVQAPPPPVISAQQANVEIATEVGRAAEQILQEKIVAPAMEANNSESDSPFENAVSRTRRKIEGGNAILKAANKIRDNIHAVTDRVQDVQTRVNNAVDTVTGAANTAGEMAVGGATGAVAAGATGSAETGLALAGLTSTPVLIAGGIAALFLLSKSGGKSGRR